MASRGYYFDMADGRRYAVPSPGVFLCPTRCMEAGWNDYPSWLVEFTRGDIWYFRRFGEYPTYSLEKLGDGTFEFRDVEIDTVLYTMTPTYTSEDVFDGYSVEWLEYVSDSRPEKCDLEGDCILPVDDSGDEWGEFRLDLRHLVFPVYSLSYTMMEITEGEGEEEVCEYALKYLLDLSFENEDCELWDYDRQDSAASFSLGKGKYDTQHRRLYALGGVDWTVLFGDDGFVLYDDGGDRVGNGFRFVHDDDESFNDGWGADSLSSLALEDYLNAFSSDTRRARSAELRTDVWNASVDAEENPLDKVTRMIRMFLDAELEEAETTWPIEIPPNYRRIVEGADAEIVATRTGWEILDSDGNTLYTVTVSGDGDGTAWNFHEPSRGTPYILRPVGDGTFEVSANDGTPAFLVVPQDTVGELEPTGEYSFENLYPALTVTDPDGLPLYAVGRPEKRDDPFDSLTFAEFVDSIPLRKVDGAWITYADDPKYYESESDSVEYWRDIYDRHNVLAYRISKPSEWDEDDREIYSTDSTKVATFTTLSLVSNKTGSEIAKMYADPDALYTYQLFDNTTGGYNYLTRYSNDMVVVVNAKGNVVRYVMPNLELRGPTWHLFGTVERRQVVDTDGNVIYTFISDDGDWNIYDPDGNLVGHLYSSSTPNNEWTIAEGCQRLLTFLATESTVLVSSDGSYLFRTRDGDTEISSRVEIQANEAGVLQLLVLDEDGEEIYRITPNGSSYQIDHVNGVAVDTATAYETYSQGNMVLTRYWSTPYNRMMYSCTNDQLEGTFDDLDGSDQDGVPSPLHAGSNVGGRNGRSVSYSVSGVSASTPRTLAADSTSSGSSDGGSGGSLGTPDSIQDLMDTMSDFYDGINGVLSKDTNTSKGEDLDPDEPLQISQTETDGRLIADAVFNNPSVNAVEAAVLADAYDYTQAITRLSKMYSLGRADIYKEAQDYAATRTKRIEAKKAAFLNAMNKSKEIAQKTGNA